MFRKNVLGSLLLAVALTPVGGCVVSGQARVAEPVAVVEVDEEPPPPRQEVFEVRPGFVWITGHWYRGGGRWEWQAGHYERERAGYVWAPGRWEVRGRRHVWIEGEWRAGASPAVRDHREDREEGHGPVVRDHRH